MNNLKSPEAFVVAAVVDVDASAAVALSDAADRNEPDSPAAGDGGASAELAAVAAEQLPHHGIHAADRVVVAAVVVDVGGGGYGENVTNVTNENDSTRAAVELEGDLSRLGLACRCTVMKEE